MHLRRALLLFAIVLGLAAIAASVSRSPTGGRSQAPPERLEPPAAAPERSSELRLEGPRGRRRAVLRAGRARTLSVAVIEPGQVELPELGLSSPAEPLTPARFELLVDEPGSYGVEFTPASSTESRGLGALIVR